VENLAAAVGGRAHPINLLLDCRNNLVVARQREEPVASGEQQRNAVSNCSGFLMLTELRERMDVEFRRASRRVRSRR